MSDDERDERRGRRPPRASSPRKKGGPRQAQPGRAARSDGGRGAPRDGARRTGRAQDTGGDDRRRSRRDDDRRGRQPRDSRRDDDRRGRKPSRSPRDDDRGGRKPPRAKDPRRSSADKRSPRRPDTGRRDGERTQMSRPIRGRYVDYPSRRYRTNEEPEPETPRRPSLRAVRGSDNAAAAPAKGVTQRPRKKAPPPKPSAATRRRRAKRTEASEELARLAGRNAGRARTALERAAAAYAEGRERDAARDLRALRDAYPTAAGVRELLGLTDYRLGHYGVAAKELEAFTDLTGSVEQHPVLMDCYRAQRRYDDVNRLWHELSEASPSADLVAEGRIVAAGALADQRLTSDAIALLERKAGDTKRVQPHHLRLWYALADLYERSGEIPRARELFERIRKREPDFVDVAERLAALG